MRYKLAGFYSWSAVGNTKLIWKFMIYGTNLKVHGKNQNLDKVHDVRDQFPFLLMNSNEVILLFMLVVF